MSRVAVLGLGAMGSRIAAQLLSAGHEVVVWNRTPAKAEPLVELGAEAAASPAEAARGADLVVTMLADADGAPGRGRRARGARGRARARHDRDRHVHRRDRCGGVARIGAADRHAAARGARARELARSRVGVAHALRRRAGGARAAMDAALRGARHRRPRRAARRRAGGEARRQHDALRGGRGARGGARARRAARALAGGRLRRHRVDAACGPGRAAARGDRERGVPDAVPALAGAQGHRPRRGRGRRRRSTPVRGDPRALPRGRARRARRRGLLGRARPGVIAASRSSA